MSRHRQYSVRNAARGLHAGSGADGFRPRITVALHESYGHRDGEHDDLLLAPARTVWAGEHTPGVMAV